MALELQPLRKDRRHPADYRDEIEYAEIAAILAELPENHPARAAYYVGAREASDSLSLSHFVADRADLVQRLVAAYTSACARIWRRYSGASHFSQGSA